MFTFRPVPFILFFTFLIQTAAGQAGIIAQNDSTHLNNLSRSGLSLWVSIPKPTGWVNDFEGLYSDDEERTLDSMISIFKMETSIEITIVTIDTSFTQKDRFEDLTLHIARTWGIGEKGSNNGILIGISRGYRKMRIENGYGIEKLISDNETKIIIDSNFIPHFRNGEYFQGTLSGLEKLIDLLKTRHKLKAMEDAIRNKE